MPTIYLALNKEFIVKGCADLSSPQMVALLPNEVRKEERKKERRKGQGMVVNSYTKGKNNNVFYSLYE